MLKMVIICFFIPKLSQYMILAHCGIYYPSKIPADRDRWQNFFTPKTRFLRFTILESRFKIGPSLGKYNSHQENFGFGHCLLKTVFFIHISHQKKIMKTGLIFPKHYQNRFQKNFLRTFTLTRYIFVQGTQSVNCVQPLIVTQNPSWSVFQISDILGETKKSSFTKVGEFAQAFQPIIVMPNGMKHCTLKCS